MLRDDLDLGLLWTLWKPAALLALWCHFVVCTLPALCQRHAHWLVIIHGSACMDFAARPVFRGITELCCLLLFHSLRLVFPGHFLVWAATSGQHFHDVSA